MSNSELLALICEEIYNSRTHYYKQYERGGNNEEMVLEVMDKKGVDKTIVIRIIDK